jgi:F-box-like
MGRRTPHLQPAPSKKSKTAKLAKLNPMKWFKKKKSRTFEPIEVREGSLAPYGTPPVSSQLWAKLPGPLLERIFSFVCPHTQDQTYESCEQSAVEDTCMLCDARDLAHCAQVSRKWRVHATNLLYVETGCGLAGFGLMELLQVPQHTHRRRPLLRTRRYPC